MFRLNLRNKYFTNFFSNSLANSFIKYYQERFKPIPWLLIPFLLLFFNYSNILSIIYLCILYLYITSQLCFFRLFDDLNMLSYDKNCNKDHKYYNNISDLKKLLVLPLALSQLFTFCIFNLISTVATLIFITICFSLYKILKNHKLSSLISILKYFWLSYLINQGFSWWVLTTFILFLIYELIEEKIITLKPLFFQYLFITAIAIKSLIMLRD